MLSTDRIQKPSSFDTISGTKLLDIFHCEYQDCFLATANPRGYIMPGYLHSTHFTGGHVIKEARLTKLKIHLNVEGKSISCLAGSGNWYLNSSSCISDTHMALQLGKSLPDSLEEKQAVCFTRLIMDHQSWSCTKAAWVCFSLGNSELPLWTSYAVCIKANWF